MSTDKLELNFHSNSGSIVLYCGELTMALHERGFSKTVAQVGESPDHLKYVFQDNKGKTILSFESIDKPDRCSVTFDFHTSKDAVKYKKLAKDLSKDFEAWEDKTIKL